MIVKVSLRFRSYSPFSRHSTTARAPDANSNIYRQISTTIQKNLNSIRTKARHSALKWCLAQLISGIDLHHLLDIVGNF
uniref:Uncharacterized protein n=1 Tax=Trichogramma kaykai TaxID=54128 RepID=A0ABD2VU51_9HYME